MATKLSALQLIQMADDESIIGPLDGSEGYIFFDQQAGTTGFFIVNGVPAAQGATLHILPNQLSQVFFPAPQRW